MGALNGLLEEVSAASRSQQASSHAAHQLRTPPAGLQAHTEPALAQPMPEGCRTQLEQVHRATIRTGRLANQFALARTEPRRARLPRRSTSRASPAARPTAWLRQSLTRDIDLGFELEPAPVQGDAFCCARRFEPRAQRDRVLEPRRPRHGAHRAAQRPRVPRGRGRRAGNRARRARARARALLRVPGTPGTGSGLGLAIVREIARAMRRAPRRRGSGRRLQSWDNISAWIA